MERCRSETVRWASNTSWIGIMVPSFSLRWEPRINSDEAVRFPLPWPRHAVVPQKLPRNLHWIACEYFPHPGNALLRRKWRVGAAHVGFHPARVKQHDTDPARFQLFRENG